MAKGKNAAALFEVINKDRRPGAKASLRTPAWWTKNKPLAPGEVPAAGSGASPAPKGPGFRFTSTSMMFIGAGIVIGLLLALFARRGSDRPTLSAHTTDELRALPANPQVMEVKRGEAGLTPLPQKTTTKTNTPVQTPAPSPVDNPAPVQQPFDGKRTVGLNYVIIQSYPEQKGAEEARDVLAKAGVSTTIEKGLRGLNPNWFIVVGTEGFARIRSSDFENYIAKIKQISETFAKKKSFKAFEPMGYKWDKTDR